MAGSRSSSARTRLVFPAPDGAATMNSVPLIRSLPVDRPAHKHDMRRVGSHRTRSNGRSMRIGISVEAGRRQASDRCTDHVERCGSLIAETMGRDAGGIKITTWVIVLGPRNARGM